MIIECCGASQDVSCHRTMKAYLTQVIKVSMLVFYLNKRKKHKGVKKMRKRILFSLLITGLLFLVLSEPANAINPITGLAVFAGKDRYETACYIAKAGWSQSDNAVIAYGQNYPDALAAVPLAKKLNAPILLTNNDSLNADTLTVLQDLKVKTVYIIGGIGVIPIKIENFLTNADYTVKRIAGRDRYDTSIKIAEELGDSSEIAITTGSDYADALSIGPIAAEKQMPIILVPKDTITNNIQSYISSKNITKTYVIGGSDIISEDIMNKFINPERIIGQDKYCRNIAILNKFTDAYQHDIIYLATGENFADALTGAVYSAKNNGAVTLVKSNLPASTRKYLEENITSSTTFTVFGGEGAVPLSLVKTISNSNYYTEEKLDFGTLNGQIYHNTYFGFQITIPNNFSIPDTNVAITKALPANKEIANSGLSGASDFNDVILIRAFSTNGTPCNFFVEAKKSPFYTVDECLAYFKSGLVSENPEYTTVFPKEIYLQKIDGINFKVLEFSSINKNDLSTLYCKEYVVLRKGYVLIFTKVYTDNIDNNDMNLLFNSINFKQ